MTFNLIVSLHLRHEVTDRTTWPTPRRLKDELRMFGLASERRIDSLVARLIQLGYVESRPSEQDGRVRILSPTDKMMSLDRDWLVYHYVPLQVMFPDPGLSRTDGAGSRVPAGAAAGLGGFFRPRARRSWRAIPP